MGAVNSQPGTSKHWKIEVCIEGENVHFKVDPVADVTIISENFYSKFFLNSEMALIVLKTVFTV